MTKPLTIVGDPATNLPRPTRELGSPGRDLWQSVMAEYCISDPGGLAILMQACCALDRAEQLSEAIGTDVVVHSRSGSRPHPALSAELAARSLVCRTIERLGLNLEAVRPIGRTSGHRDGD